MAMSPRRPERDESRDQHKPYLGVILYHDTPVFAHPLRYTRLTDEEVAEKSFTSYFYRYYADSFISLIAMTAILFYIRKSNKLM
jgi:hypothetical protein